MPVPLISSSPLSRRSTRAVQAGDVLHRFVAAKITSLGAREFEGVAATDSLCEQDGVALVMSGANLSQIQGGPLSWNHEFPIGTITRAYTTTHEVLIRAETLPAGVDKFVDGITDRLKGGAPQQLSLQFRVITAEPIVPGRPDKGIRATSWEALEVALVLVGADPGAFVTARARKGSSPMKSHAPAVESALDEARALGRH